MTLFEEITTIILYAACVQTMLEIIDHKKELEQGRNIYSEIWRESEGEIEPNQKIDKTGIKKEGRITINEFVRTFSNIEHIDTRRLNKNFKPYMIEMTDKDVPPYDRKRKKIRLSSTDTRASLLRALLDLSSMYEYADGETYGFESIGNAIVGKDYWHGRGLNEGYKDVLLKRYFNVEPAYPELARLALFVEYIVGRVEMEKLFFKGELRLFYNKFPIRGKSFHLLLMDFDRLFYYLDGNTYAGVFNAKKSYNRIFSQLSKIVIDKARTMYNSHYDEDQGGLYGGLDAILKNRRNANVIISEINQALEARYRVLDMSINDQTAKDTAEHGSMVLRPDQYQIRKR